MNRATRLRFIGSTGFLMMINLAQSWVKTHAPRASSSHPKYHRLFRSLPLRSPREVHTQMIPVHRKINPNASEGSSLSCRRS